VIHDTQRNNANGFIFVQIGERSLKPLWD